RIDDRGEAATGFQLRLERPQDDEELLAQLSRRFGFEPDFVWVAPGSLPIDAEWNVDPDEIGHDQHPEFVAGDLCAGMYRHRRDLEFTVWDLWADWRGLVHSS
ncbi:MAG: hypothetical protein KTR31_32195, partial [Myxococcales bacterium]|nr:hypothetical protein [Myxococcales bacterium]